VTEIYLNMNFLENITFRRRSHTKSDSIVAESTSEDTLNGSASSLPSLSEVGDTVQQLSMLNEEIKKLTIELNSAHH
jgi:hypothetical protein